MKRYEALETLFSKVDLSLAQKILIEPFHPVGSRGRPPRNPLGLFKAHLVKRLKHIPSDRMLVRQMWKDPRLKKICDIEANEPPYGIAVLSRFRSKLGPERLSKVVDQAVEVLVRKRRIRGEAFWILLSSRHTVVETLTTEQVTAILTRGLEEQLRPKTWVTGFIWLSTLKASCPSR